jgi:hypothetical protein
MGFFSYETGWPTSCNCIAKGIVPLPESLVFVKEKPQAEQKNQAFC